MNGPDSLTTPGGYDPSFFAELARVEDKHFWFRSRNQLIFNLASAICSSFAKGYSVLEVGCGTGNVLRTLCRACPDGKVVGMELWLDGLRFARSRSSAALVQGDARNCPFTAAFHLIGLFDVLEHIGDDKGTLLALRDMLAPGGRLLLTVPAHQSLWSYFDEASCHCRRYSLNNVRQKLVESGFEVEFLSEFMTCLFPLVWMLRRLSAFFDKGRDRERAKRLTTREFAIVPLLNGMIEGLLSLEVRWLSRRRRLPVGTSIVAIARRAGPNKSIE